MTVCDCTRTLRFVDESEARLVLEPSLSNKLSLVLPVTLASFVVRATERPSVDELVNTRADPRALAVGARSNVGAWI